MKQYGLTRNLPNNCGQRVRDLFEIAWEGKRRCGFTVSVFLTETIKALKREGIRNWQRWRWRDYGYFWGCGRWAIGKESLGDVFSWLAKKSGQNRWGAIEALGLKMLSEVDLKAIIEKVVAQNQTAVDKLGKGAFGLLMGAAMKEVRGKANPDLVGKLLRQRLPWFFILVFDIFV